MAQPQQNMARSTKHSQPWNSSSHSGIHEYPQLCKAPQGQRCPGTQHPHLKGDEGTAQCAWRGPKRGWAVSAHPGERICFCAQLKPPWETIPARRGFKPIAGGVKPPHFTLCGEHRGQSRGSTEWDTKVAPLLRGGEGISRAKEGQDPKGGGACIPWGVLIQRGSTKTMLWRRARPKGDQHLTPGWGVGGTTTQSRGHTGEGLRPKREELLSHTGGKRYTTQKWGEPTVRGMNQNRAQIPHTRGTPPKAGGPTLRSMN